MNDPSLLRVALGGDEATNALVYSADAPAGAALILAHGAGAEQRSPFMVGFAAALSALGVDVVTFNFLYIERHRRVPDRAPDLERCYRASIGRVLETVSSARHALFIGGKSMGGRIATQVAAADPALPIAGVVLLGYPLHPPGQPERRRDAHLASVKRPMLFVQGERDSFGTPAELEQALGPLDPPAALEIVERGDHSFKVPRASAREQAAVYDRVQRRIAAWLTGRVKGGSLP